MGARYERENIIAKGNFHEIIHSEGDLAILESNQYLTIIENTIDK